MGVFFEMDGKQSRGRSPKSGLPQGSVLGATLFTMYINDRSIFADIRRSIYADDCVLQCKEKVLKR